MPSTGTCLKKGGVSNYFSPHNILRKRSIDYQKHLEHSFSSYVIASHEEKIKNNPKPRGLDAIYISPAKNLQGGHEVMDLATGRVITRPKVTPMRMTDLVVNHVNNMAKKQGLRSMKFFNRKRQEIVFTPNDLLVGVGSGSTPDETVLEDDDEEHRNNLPDPEGEPELPGELSDDHELDVDEKMDENEVADLLEDARIQENNPNPDSDEREEARINDPEVDQGVEDDEDVGICAEPDLGEEEPTTSEPDLVSEIDEESRPTRIRSQPTRYNPATGRNYYQQGGKYCESMIYGKNAVPKAVSSQNKKIWNEIARGYIQYLKGREICHNMIVADAKQAGRTAIFWRRSKIFGWFYTIRSRQ